MMNTVVVSQPSAAAGEAADRSRDAGRQGPAEGEDGSFPELLSKLAGNREHTDRPAGSSREPRSGGRDVGRGLDWWRDNAEAPVDGERAADPELVIDQRDAGAGELSDADNTAPRYALNSGGVEPGANWLAIASAGGGANAATAGRVVANAAPMRGIPVMQDGLPLSPEEPDLANMARVLDPTVEPASGDVKTTATLTVLRRETHLAPTQAVAAINGGSQWAVELPARGNTPGRASARPGATASRTGEALLPTGDAIEHVAHVRPVVPEVAVAAASNAQSGEDWRQGSSPTAHMRTAPDTLPESGGEHIVAVARSDSLLNSGLGSSVSQQIANRVASEASSFAPQVGRSEMSAFVVKHESPIKVLHIQLQPADLGIVTIRMTVKDASLRLDLEVGRGETARMIQRDREALSALLRSAGYLVDGVEVRLADQSGTGAQISNNPANMQMQGGQSGSSHSEAGLPGERSHEDRRNSQFGNRTHGEDEMVGNAPGRGGIYL